VSWAAYLQYWRINLLTMIEYRANFFMWFGFTIVYHATAIAALWVTLHQFPSMNGWDFKQMAVLYGLWMLGHAFHNTFFFTVGEVPTMIWPDELILAFIFFGFVTVYSGLRVDALYVVFVPLVMVGGALIDFGIQLAIATLSFWVIRIDTLRWVVMSLEQDFTRYPISIYTRAVRVVLAFVLPFAFMNYFPATFLLHKQDGALALSPNVGLLTPVVGALWLALAYGFWRAGLQKYQGTGS
jgi:ABC-2 type transport system permease protein